MILQLVVQCLLACAVAQQAQWPLDGTGRSDHSPRKPNIIFILTDDQDLHMDSLSYMPNLRHHLTEQGTFFRRHHCTVALCCPSRASIWTGKAAHNTNVTDVNPPHGGYPKFVSQGFNEAYLPIWLQDTGYSTYYTGKLFNAHSVTNYDQPFPRGWTGSDFLLDPYTYEYLNATFQRNRDAPVSYHGHYSTDVLISKALSFLSEALAEPAPFFLTIAPTAPHSNVNIKDNIIDNFTEHSVTQSPPIPASRHAELFAEVTVPRTPHFNPDSAHGVSWISRLPQQNKTNIDFNDHFYRSRLRALQPVDELIPSIIEQLTAAGQLDNTYIVYSTDNGYHIGQHRLQPGKQCAYEEDVNIPFIIRGPGVPKNVSTNAVTNHVDLAPTFLQMAGVELKDEWQLDGQAMPLNARALQDAARSGAAQEHVNIESWGIIMSEGKYGAELYPNHTYKALRVVGEQYNLLYTVWCSGERELYDLNSDPHATHNIHPPLSTHHGPDPLFIPLNIPLHTPPDHPSFLTAPPLFPPPAAQALPPLTTAPSSIPILRLLTRLNALLATLRTCVGRQCTHPWEVLHPDRPAEVKTLLDALDERFDEMYAEKGVWGFGWCEKGYIAEAEEGWLEEAKGWGWMGLEVDVGALGRGGAVGVGEGEGEEIKGEGEEGEGKEEWLRTEL